MSESSVPTQTSFTGAPSFNSAAQEYQLSDELAKLCLPQEFKDSYRTLAWVNSVCALFLMIGLVGLKAPKVVIKPLSEIVDSVPVVFTPPEEPQKIDPETTTDEPDDQPQDTPADTPQVITIVAAADSSAVAFAVPVPGAVAIAPMAHLATPPPPRVTTQKPPPPKPVQFNPYAAADEGSFPPPEYPGIAQRNRYQGTVLIEIKVDADGTITSASVFKSSGFKVLDDAALQVVQRRWRFTSGKDRWLHWPCRFEMR